MSSNQIPYDWWIGYHERYGLSDDFSAGVVRDYTVNRLLSFVDWVAENWEIDRTRIFVTGASMGGSERA